VRGRARYLGKVGSSEAERNYREFISDWAAGRPEATDSGKSMTEAPTAEVVTVSIAILRFWEWATVRYRNPDGSSTREDDNLRCALRPLRRLFGPLPLEQFSPNKLRAVREEMVRDGLARRTVNRRVGRIRFFFRWCAGRELVPYAVVEALKAVEPLAVGQGARDCPSRSAVAWSTVEATLPYLPELLRAMVKVLWFTGARVGEVVKLTTGDIDRSGDVWRATLDRHKNAHRGHTRTLLFGPEAQEALRPWLRPEKLDAPIFSPRRVDARAAKRDGPRRPGVVYSRVSPGQAIRRACVRGGVTPWTLAQLRHSRATVLRERFGIDVAAAVLGHAKPMMTAHYSKSAIAHAVEAIRQAG
jgi:integrase